MLFAERPQRKNGMVKSFALKNAGLLVTVTKILNGPVKSVTNHSLLLRNLFRLELAESFAVMY